MTTATDLTPALQSDVQRRATRLCVLSEPHTDAWPCARHVQEALSQLFSAPAQLRQVDEEGGATGTETGGSGFWV